MRDVVRVVFLGTRGSAPVSGDCFRVYGGATSCVLVNFVGVDIVFDCGTGLSNVSSYFSGNPVSIFLSHPHLDHVEGFPVSEFVYKDEFSVDLYSRARSDFSTKDYFSYLMRMPFWPVSLSDLKNKIRFHDLGTNNHLVIPSTVSGADISIQCFEVNHRGGCTAFRVSQTISGIEKSIVYATDMELSKTDRAFWDFSRDCDLLIIDAQYTDAEYAERTGWGHSRISESIQFAHDVGAKCTRLFHHDPQRGDRELADMEAGLPESIRFAKMFEEVELGSEEKAVAQKLSAGTMTN